MIRFLVALPAEATPLIDRYRLKRRPIQSDFPVYENEDIVLIVSGAGKVAAAAATGYLHALTDSHSHGVWLNVGIAGHGECAVGDGVFAHRITDQKTKRSWYPPLLFDPPCKTDAVLTVDKPEHTYSESCVYDMEASGYYPIACRFSTAELVHCFKVISDNRAVGAETVNPKSGRHLIAKQLDVIDHIARQLSALSAELPEMGPDPCQLNQFLERWHFTVTEQHKLCRLLTRWQALTPDQDPWCDELDAMAKGDDVLVFLEQRLDALPMKPW